MRILHTADWHLGRSLYGRQRYREFEQFLDWLIETIQDQRIDILLIAGDVFDSSTPSNRAQQLYYRFLYRIAQSDCQHVVVIAGNHDSPTFLDAPKQLLEVLSVHVVGSLSERLDDEVLMLSVSHSAADLTDTSESQAINSKAITSQAIICAVPYLRDKDIRTAEPGENIDQKNAQLVNGIKQHYQSVVDIAERKRQEKHQEKRQELLSQSTNSDTYIPIIAMGHLFTAGGKTIEGDGVRELYVGSLAHVEATVFPSSIDYLALGHLHVPQRIANTDHMRYSGSPIPMGFAEANQQKQVIVLEFNPQSNAHHRPLSDDATPTSTSHRPRYQIEVLAVPNFQELKRIVGDTETIVSEIERLNNHASRAWLEIEYTGTDAATNVRDIIDQCLVGSELEILRIKNQQLMRRLLGDAHPAHQPQNPNYSVEDLLEDLDEYEVFQRCLDDAQIPKEEQRSLQHCYAEIVQHIHEQDIHAE